MKQIGLLAVACLVLGGVARGQGPTPELGDVAGAVREYVAELQAATVELQQRLKTEETAARQFEQYVRRMRGDAVVQRTLLAVGTLRLPALVQAERNWGEWEAIARQRVLQAKESVDWSTRVRQDEEERWELFGDEGAEGVVAGLGESYGQAQQLRARKLALLSRLEAVATRSAQEAEKAAQLCVEVEEAIVHTRERVKTRFLLTRASLADLPGTLADTRADIEFVAAPLTSATLGEWRTNVVDFARANAIALLTALLVGGVLLWRGRILVRYVRVTFGRLGTLSWMPQGLPRRLAWAVGSALSRSTGLGLTAVVVLLLRGALGSRPADDVQLLFSVVLALFAWRVLYVLVGAAFEPDRPERRLAPMTDERATVLRRQLQRLTVWFFVTTLAATLVRRGSLTAAPLLLGFALLELLALRAVRRVLRTDGVAVTEMPEAVARWARRWRGIVGALAVLMIGAAGFGFVNLAWHIGWSTVKTTGLLAGVVLLWHVGTALIEQGGVRSTSGLSETLQRTWAGVIVAVVISVLPFAWDLDEAVWPGVQRILAFGVSVGDHRITVLRVAIAVLWIAGAAMLGRGVGAALERRVFARLQFDIGLQTAIVRSGQYVLMAAAVLAAIRTLGFDLTNLAIMAGALSVGIGFGLQGLVSNFVSGLVILFERPFRLGDILEHDGVFGTVRRIRTRSTVLRTFDEAEMVLPNAELLAGKITNWTLTDNRARAVIPVGVAYGSDVTGVRETLLRVAKAHPRVLDEPRVYFTAFGDSALQFRLMIWVDIRERMQVISDLHFAIDGAFRELGIEIPFPQQDVHVYPRPSETSCAPSGRDGGGTS